MFNGPNARGGSSLIQSFRHKNFLYYTYDAKYVGQYTFYLSEAETYTKAEAQKKAAMMTRNTKVGRVWFGLQIK